MVPHPTQDGAAAATLLWIPVGAGGHIVRRTSRWWERAHAFVARRKPRQLLHAALEISLGAEHYVIEMAPQWGGPRVPDRGVVTAGPVGLHWLGRSILFRYEVRCWPGGTIPDRSWAVGGSTVSKDVDTVRLLLRRIVDVPTLTWGRSVLDTRDMWNSNSLVSWLLVVSGIPIDDVRPPDGCWAPGWTAGIALATQVR